MINVYEIVSCRNIRKEDDWIEGLSESYNIDSKL